MNIVLKTITNLGSVLYRTSYIRDDTNIKESVLSMFQMFWFPCTIFAYLDICGF